MLKVLHCSLVRLCCVSRCECPKIPALPSLGALFTGIETILAVLEFANHDRNFSVVWRHETQAAFRVRLPFAPSVREEVHFIEPHIIRFLPVVTIHLKSDINFFLVPLRLGRVVDINGIFLTRNADTDVVDLIADTFQVPHKVDPCIGWKVITRN